MSECRTARRARVASYIPLRITARLRCGVISDGLLPFDGLIDAAAHREQLGAHLLTLSRQRAIVDDPLEASITCRLPIKRIAIQGAPDFYYAASCAQWPAAVADGVDYWTKRLDSRYVEFLPDQRARVSTSGGRYRGYRMPIYYRHALSVSWYVVGEPVALERLLSLVTHIGKKREMGWGAVIDWRIEAQQEDWSVTGPRGELMRPVPDPAGTPYGLRPPYWLPRNIIPCRLPDLGQKR